MSWPWIMLIAIAGAVLLVAVLRVVLRNLGGSRIAEADELLKDEEVVLREPAANLFGVRSQGMGQVRGNGVLTLTNRRLHFLLWLPRRELSIELPSIRGIQTPTSFLGKSRFTPLLQVNFITERGEENAAAWQVADLEAWTEALRGSMQR